MSTAATDVFDVFLSHNSQDKPAVRRLAKALQRRGLRVWLDEWHLIPGHSWQEAVENVISSTKSIAILIGKHGLGPWETPELRASLNQQVNRKLPVIPVLLPGADVTPVLPLFLQDMTWVDLRKGFDKEGVSRLVWGITAEINADNASTRSLSRNINPDDSLRLVDVSIEETDKYPKLGIKLRNIGFQVAFLKKATFAVSRLYTIPLLLQPRKVPVSWNYDIELPVREAPFSASFDIAQVVGPGRVDYFTLTLRSNTDDIKDYFIAGYLYCTTVELEYNEKDARLVSEPLQFIIPSPRIVAGSGLPGESYERSFVHIALACIKLETLAEKKSKRVLKLIDQVKTRTRVVTIEVADQGACLSFGVSDPQSNVVLALADKQTVMWSFSTVKPEPVRKVILDGGFVKIACQRYGRVLDIRNLDKAAQDQTVEVLTRMSKESPFELEVSPKTVAQP